MTQLYLISSPQINLKDFLPRLKNCLKTNAIPIFQLRLKGYKTDEVKKIAQEIKKLCDDFNCKFLLNDDFKTALELDLSGVHVGSDDGDIEFIKKNSPKDFIIGASCYDSKALAIKAANSGASYISFGTFFPSQTKNSIGKPDPKIISWAKENINLPIVGIGGINASNCHLLIEKKIDYLAIISYIWNSPLQEVSAINNLLDKIKNYYNEDSKT